MPRYAPAWIPSGLAPPGNPAVMTLLRSTLFNLYFFAMTLALCLWGLLTCWRSPERALPLGRLWARLAVGGADRLCGVRLQVTGAEHLPQDGPALIAAQHQSAYDTMVWFTAGAAARLRPEAGAGVLAPVRPPGDAGRDDLGGSQRRIGRHPRAAARHRPGGGRAAPEMVIFPEGTRAAFGAVPQLQPGVAAMARQTGLPVIPVRTDSGRCWGRRAFSKRAGIVHMQVLPPLPAGLARAELMQRLQDAYEAVDNTVGPTPPVL